jgi:hypothetical protein
MSNTNTVTYTPVVDLHFSGAQSGKRYNLKAYKPIDIEPSEVVHLDPKDLRLGLVERPRPKPTIRIK